MADLLWEKNTVPWLISPGWNQLTNMLRFVFVAFCFWKWHFFPHFVTFACKGAERERRKSGREGGCSAHWGRRRWSWWVGRWRRGRGTRQRRRWWSRRCWWRLSRARSCARAPRCPWGAHSCCCPWCRRWWGSYRGFRTSSVLLPAELTATTSSWEWRAVALWVFAMWVSEWVIAERAGQLLIERETSWWLMKIHISRRALFRNKTTCITSPCLNYSLGKHPFIREKF